MIDDPGEVIKGIDCGQLTGMDRAYEQIPYIGAPLGLVK